MARTRKIGLEYFPMDTDVFQDIKVRKLIKFQGGKAVTVYTLLLCLIYKDGYYMRWDEELPFIISEQTGFEEAYIREVITCCMKVGLFDTDLFKQNIISSKGIQKRYKLIKELSRSAYVMEEYNLIPAQEKAINAQEKAINAQEKAINAQEKAINAQECNKENKSKVNKKKIKEKRKENFSLYTEKPGFSEGEREIDFQKFKEYYNYCVKYYNAAIHPIEHITAQRKEALQKLIAAGYSKEEITKVIKMAAAAPSLNARTKKGFVPDFDWIFTERNFIRILEGNFNQT